MADGKVVIDVVLEDGKVVKGVANLDKRLGGVQSSGRKAAAGIRDIAVALGLVGLASKAINLVTRSIDGAISRYDTLNNFPLVLQQIGFSAEDSQKAINRLSDGIQGLPTTLDDVAGTAQRIAVMTGDLDGAVDTTLALNNAFISSGSDAANASRGLQQYVEMLSRGEVDLTAWRTLQETMGVALNDVAKAFGFAGASAQNDLYDALKEGHITFDQFNKKLIELSNETNGFADRARTASGGIRTAWANMGTAVVRGLTNIITSIDSMLAGTSLKSIENIIQNMGNAFFKVLDGIANAIEPTARAISKLYDALKPLTPLIAGVVAGLIGFQLVSILTPAVLALGSAISLLRTPLFLAQYGFLALNTAMKANPVGWIVGALVGLITTITVLWKTNQKFRDIVVSSWNAVQDVVAATSRTFEIATNNISEFLGELADASVKEFNTAMDWTSNAVEKASDQLRVIGGYVSDFIDTLQTGTINGFNTAMDWLASSSRKVVDFFIALKESIDIKEVLGAVVGPLTTIATLFLGLASPIGWAIKGFALLATQTSVFKDLMSVFSGDMSFGQFVNNFAKQLSDLITTMAESAADMITEGAEMISGFIKGASKRLPEIVKVGTEAITNFTEGVATSISEVAPIATDTITKFIETLAKEIPQIANIGVDVITTFIESITSALPMVIEAGIGIIMAIVNSIVTVLPMLLETGVMIIIAIIEAIVTNLPLLIGIGMQIVTTLIETIVTMLPLLIETSLQLIMTIIETIISMIPVLIDTYIMLMQTLIDTVIQMLPLIIDVILTLIMTIVQTLIENLPLIIDAGIQILLALVEGIISILPALIDAIITIVQAILEVLIENLPLIIDAGIQILMALIDGIISVLPALINAAAQLISALVSTLIGLLPELINAGIQILLALIKGIISVVPQLIQAGITLIIQLVKAIIGMVPQLLSAGKDLILALIDGVLSLGGTLLDAGIDIVDGMVSGISGMAGDMLQTGKDLVGGLIDGIGNMGSSAIEAITGVVGGVIKKAKSLLQTASPSKLFKQIGGWVSEGLAIGIDKDAKEAINASGRLAKGVEDGFNPNFTNRLRGVTTPEQALGTNRMAYNAGSQFVDAFKNVQAPSSNSNNNATTTLLREQNGLLKALLNKPQDLYLDSEKVTGKVNENNAIQAALNSF